MPMQLLLAFQKRSMRTPSMPRKPITIEVVEEDHERYVLLTYANGQTVKQPVEADKKARRRPRRPQTRLKLSEQNKPDR